MNKMDKSTRVGGRRSATSGNKNVSKTSGNVRQQGGNPTPAREGTRAAYDATLNNLQFGSAVGRFKARENNLPPAPAVRGGGQKISSEAATAIGYLTNSVDDHPAVIEYVDAMVAGGVWPKIDRIWGHALGDANNPDRIIDFKNGNTGGFSVTPPDQAADGLIIPINGTRYFDTAFVPSVSGVATDFSMGLWAKNTTLDTGVKFFMGVDDATVATTLSTNGSTLMFAKVNQLTGSVAANGTAPVVHDELLSVDVTGSAQRVLRNGVALGAGNNNGGVGLPTQPIHVGDANGVGSPAGFTTPLSFIGKYMTDEERTAFQSATVTFLTALGAI